MTLQSPRISQAFQRLGIYRSGQQWMVSFAQDPAASSVRELFATTELPAPFLASADAALVIAVIRAQNSGCIITRLPDVPAQQGSPS